MIFKPALVCNAIIEPLRYLFTHYVEEDIRYDPDIKKSRIAITSIFDLNQETKGFLPRIVVDRGDFSLNGIGLSDSLAEGKTMAETKGLRNEIKGAGISGAAGLSIVATNEGTVERLADIVYHFLLAFNPVICNAYGFKVFGMPMGVSRPLISREDQPTFRINITLPYVGEEHWRVFNDAAVIRDIITKVEVSMNQPD